MGLKTGPTSVSSHHRHNLPTVDIVPYLGNLPENLSLVFSGVALHRTRRVADFDAQLFGSTGITPDRLKQAVGQSERLGDLLVAAVVVAAGCEDRERRRWLARAVVEGIEDGVSIDDAQLFVQTMRDVGPLHMRLLALIPQSGGCMTIQQMELAWPDAVGTLEPLKALLNREGLIEDMELGMGNVLATGAWGLTRYGHRFLDFVNTAEINQAG